MAVGRRFRRRFGADDAARAALVVGDDLPAQALGELEGDHAPDDVVAAAGRERDDEAYRLGRIRLCGGVCVQRDGEEREQPEGARAQGLKIWHCYFLLAKRRSVRGGSSRSGVMIAGTGARATAAWAG